MGTTSRVDVISSIFPQEERMRLWRKSNKMLKVSVSEVIRFWRRYADPLRGTIVATNSAFFLVNHRRSGVVHVSDIVKTVIYGEREVVMPLTEHKLRLLARGILYHVLFKRAFAPRVTGLFELPIAHPIDDVVLVGTLDALVFLDKPVLIEVKSSTTDATINFGILQLKMYWCMLKQFSDIDVSEAYVVTPKAVVPVDAPMSRRELVAFIRHHKATIPDAEPR